MNNRAPRPDGTESWNSNCDAGRTAGRASPCTRADTTVIIPPSARCGDITPMSRQYAIRTAHSTRPLPLPGTANVSHARIPHEYHAQASSSGLISQRRLAFSLLRKYPQ